MTGTCSSEQTTHAGEEQTRCRPRVWHRVFLLFVLLQIPFFLNGCENNSIYYTVGTAVPYCEFELDDEYRFQRVISFALLGWVANLLVIGGGLLLAARFWPWLWRQLESKLFLFVLVLTVCVFDSFWVWPGLWWNLVAHLTISLANTTQDIVSGGAVRAAPRGSWPYMVGARAYFFTWLVAGYLVLRGAAWVYRRFFTVTPQRWWQLSLSGVLAAMLILGAALGLLLRLLL